ncbi:phosphotransferase enzyme family protein [Mucilaginibacter sp. BT774]|uniref:phosphotransferase enzyme family protein n=1 Tax=Mucilaginibacter sp. BT774 TaxID=3062276 RepID=UPI002676B915|nr:aminoglycoside phosphotransferase family protein [Mucilaginibacter sp. BT774]MDO3629041.1 aminoglycoside phosphotransferase family protein [Mucilaginibacter sp. BT774]
MLNQILEQFGINVLNYQIEEYGSGLINSTWKISGNKSYILQRINTDVFKQPEAIAENLSKLQSYLNTRYPDYLFVAPLLTLNGLSLAVNKDGIFRLFPFIDNSTSINSVTDYKQAYEAAKQFGKFTFLLRDFNASELRDTIPSFHDLALRYKEFEKACLNASTAKLDQAKWPISEVNKHKDILSTYEELKYSGKFPVRVIHHDAKINNVLFDSHWNGICLIDLDTVMPGYFISDVGDMLRTYLSPANEDEIDLSKIVVDEQCFDAIYKGYLSEMSNELTSFEKEHFIYAGKFMIYMQAIRFLSDYLNGDVYYHTTYAGQNLNRANNQLTLLNQLIKIEEKIQLTNHSSIKE